MNGEGGAVRRMAGAALVFALALASFVAVAPQAALAQGIRLTPPDRKSVV